MKFPHVWTVESLREWVTSVGERKPDGTIAPIRPLQATWFKWRERFKLAWQVFTGKVDVLQWPTKD